MPGKIKQMIDQILAQKAKGDPVLLKTVKTKLLLKGINPDKYTASSEDDPVILQKLSAIAKELK